MDKKNYINTMRIAVRALLFNEKNELLVVQHHKSNFWALPGGKIENKESLKECLAREIHEELGIEIFVENLLFLQEFKWGKTTQEAKENDVTTEFFFGVRVKNSDKNNKTSKLILSGEFTEKELNKIAWKKLENTLNIKPDFLQNHTFESIEKMNANKIIKYLNLV